MPKPKRETHIGSMPEAASRAAIAGSLARHVADPEETTMADCEALRDLLTALTWSTETQSMARAAMTAVSEAVRQEGL
jgi:hypothetical protein